jgi:hypothetical protein
MAVIWVAALVLGSGFAIATGRGVKWKVLNTVIILASMGLGYGLGYAMGSGRGNMGFVPGEGATFAMVFGIVGAMTCVVRNSWNSKGD